MDRDRVEEIWARLLVGTPLTPTEEEEFLQALSSDEALRRDLLEDEEVHRTLGSFARTGGGADDFLRSLSRRLNVESDATRFLKRVEARIGPSSAAEAPRRPRTRRAGSVRRRHPLGWALPAAGVFLGIVIVFFIAPSRTAPPNRGEAKGPPARPVKSVPADTEHPRERLAALERDRARLEEERRKALEARESGRLKKAEEDLRKLSEDFRKEQELLKGAEKLPAVQKPPTPGGPAAPPEVPKSEVRTLASVATVARVEGEAWALSQGRKLRLAAGDGLAPGQGLEVGARGRLVIVFPDQTRVELGSGTVVGEVADKGGKGGIGKWLAVEKGELAAEVRPQAKDQAMGIGTPHAECRVLGTTLRITVDMDAKVGTRLDVAEGKVRMTRPSDQKSVEVVSGHYAVAATGIEPVARRSEEILLLPKQGRIFGDDWRRVRDDGASGGETLEAPRVRAYSVSATQLKARGLGYVEFTFDADANKDYTVWVRGRCLEGFHVAEHDQVFLRSFQATWTPRDDTAATLSPDFEGAHFGGYSTHAARGWGKTNLEMPFRVRFAKAGRQKLHLYGTQTPMRIDAIWLSATQKTRPDDESTGPGLNLRK